MPLHATDRAETLSAEFGTTARCYDIDLNAAAPTVCGSPPPL